MDDVYKIMRRALMSPPPQLYLDFDELWRQSVKAAKDASGERSAEEDQLVYGGWDNPSGAYLRPPLHFAQRISDTAAVCLDYVLQRGIRTLTFIEVVHVLSAWNGEKDQILWQANASVRTEHDVSRTSCALSWPWQLGRCLAIVLDSRSTSTIFCTTHLEC